MTVEHEPDNKRFILRQEQQEAVLEYRLLGAETVDFNRTFVPENLRGRGLAAELVAAGFDWARDTGLEIKASCWYADKKLQAGV